MERLSAVLGAIRDLPWRSLFIIATMAAAILVTVHDAPFARTTWTRVYLWMTGAPG
jgi:hypothetical protein